MPMRITIGRPASIPTTASARRGIDPARRETVTIEYRWTSARRRSAPLLRTMRAGREATSRAGALGRHAARHDRRRSGWRSSWSRRARWRRSASSPAASRTTSTICSPRCIGGIHVLERRLTMGEREKVIVDQMRHAAEHGAELVRRMMAFARKQDLSPTSVDPNRLCESVAGLVEHTLGGTIKRRLAMPADDQQFVRRQVAARTGAAQPDPQRARRHARRRRSVTRRDQRDQRGRGRRGADAAVGRLSAHPRDRRGQWHRRERHREDHRALLHHQGGRQGHRAGAVDGAWLRPAIGRAAAASRARSAAARRST